MSLKKLRKEIEYLEISNDEELTPIKEKKAYEFIGVDSIVRIEVLFNYPGTIDIDKIKNETLKGVLETAYIDKSYIDAEKHKFICEFSHDLTLTSFQDLVNEIKSCINKGDFFNGYIRLVVVDGLCDRFYNILASYIYDYETESHKWKSDTHIYKPAYTYSKR